MLTLKKSDDNKSMKNYPECKELDWFISGCRGDTLPTRSDAEKPDTGHCKNFTTQYGDRGFTPDTLLQNPTSESSKYYLRTISDWEG